MEIKLTYRAQNGGIFTGYNQDGNYEKAVQELVQQLMGTPNPLTDHLINQILKEPENADDILDWADEYEHVESAWSQARRYGRLDDAQVDAVLELIPDWNSQLELELMRSQLADIG